MKVKQIIDEDFVNYKKPSMYIGFPHCSFKCDKECGVQVCQNGTLATAPDIEISKDKVIDRYIKNNITEAIVVAGLEPMDDFNDLYELIKTLRVKRIYDTIVIYTGYYKNEILEKINKLKKLNNIIVKFGRYIPNQPKHFDDLLGVYLASNNQYAERISE